MNGCRNAGSGMTVRVQTEAVWELLSAKLKGFIRSRVENEQAAEDILHEASLRIHQRLATLGDEERLEGWVFQIARNLITDHYRARSRHRNDLPLETEPPQPPCETDSSNRNEEVAGWLRAAVENLPDRYRKAVDLYELQNVSQAEIAERLGLSLSGAKSRVRRGRAKLKQVLERCCRFDLDRRGNVLSCTPRGDGCDYCG
jgi:RNA polymerase sigma-70 factor (ECF subfamily)